MLVPADPGSDSLQKLEAINRASTVLKFFTNPMRSV